MNKNYLWILGIGVIIVLMMNQPESQKEMKKTGTGSFSRTASSLEVSPSSTFTVTYTATKSDNEWFVNWHEDITGCTPTSYENFMARNGAAESSTSTKVITLTAPSSVGTCTISPSSSSYYQFATEGVSNLAPITINVCSSQSTFSCSNNDIYWYKSAPCVNSKEGVKEACSGLVSNGGWGNWICNGLTQRKHSRTNVIKVACSGSQTACPTTTQNEDGTESCVNQYCEPTTNACTNGDTASDISPMNGCVSFSEISAYAGKWVSGLGPSFADVSTAAGRWINRNKVIC